MGLSVSRLGKAVLVLWFLPHMAYHMWCLPHMVFILRDWSREIVLAISFVPRVISP